METETYYSGFNKWYVLKQDLLYILDDVIWTRFRTFKIFLLHNYCQWLTQ